MFRANQPPKQRSVAKPSRLGFTLIELIVVILVISILLAILMPSIGGVFTSAREAQVVADIKNIEAAIATFKLKYGMEPPSSFLLGYTLADYSTPLGKNSLVLMRQIWPHYAPVDSPTGTQVGYPLLEFASARGGSIPGLPTAAGTPVVLNGAECLAFFLCGPNVLGSNKDLAPNGFSANPQNPFFATGSRVGPFLELDGARLKKIDDSVTTTEMCRKIFDTLPNQTRPYQYFSSYDGRGYQPFGYDTSTPSGDYDDEVIRLNGTPTMQSVYLKNDAAWANAANRPSAGGVVGNYWNGKSYQIISPGLDGEYGVGGAYSSQDGIYTKDDTYRSRDARKYEADNITNFSSGSMKKFSPK